ncbi:MAG: NAD(P)/FAD-dependent oxidoreductase [Bacteroidia bacterium]|jgi:glycine oxidase
MTDVLIVGEGLAACVTMHVLNNRNLTFKCIGHPNQSSCSRVAAGLWNPIVFKRMTESWMAHVLIPEMKRFYADAEKRMGTRFLYEMPIVRALPNQEAQKSWNIKSVNALAEWIQAADGLPDDAWKFTSAFPCRGYVNQTGYLDVNAFINATLKFYAACYQNEIFKYPQLTIHAHSIEYEGLKSKYIIFCEGYRVSENPFFNWIPLKPVKGELITLESETLTFTNAILNSNGFLIPQTNGEYTLGATYTWDFNDEAPSLEGYQALKEKAESMVKTPFKLKAPRGGIRPASSDRRPIIGRHPVYEPLLVCNGLGAKGVMLAPFILKQLFEHITQSLWLDDAIAIKRFYKKYSG